MAKKSKPDPKSGKQPKKTSPKAIPPQLTIPKEGRPKAERHILKNLKTALLRREALRASGANYFVHEEVFGRGSTLPIPRQTVKTKRPTIMAFADDAPLFNWAHSCRYLLHDAESGEMYEQIEAQFPPYDSDGDLSGKFHAFHQAVKISKPDIFRLTSKPKVRPPSPGNRFAVLFAGMADNRHTNDLEFLYRTLRDCYQVPDKNIYVLNWNGTLGYKSAPYPLVTPWPGDKTPYRMPVHSSGTKANLLGVLHDLKKRLGRDDSLLIHTNNHGGHRGDESDICCYPKYAPLGVAEFTDNLADLPKFRHLMVMMEQCHSGGFNNAVIAKSTADSTSIASACEESKSSIGGDDFDPYARDWIAAMRGLSPYGYGLSNSPDLDFSGRVSAKEAFDYATTYRDPYDTPLFAETNRGGNRSLEGA